MKISFLRNRLFSKTAPKIRDVAGAHGRLQVRDSNKHTGTIPDARIACVSLCLFSQKVSAIHLSNMLHTAKPFNVRSFLRLNEPLNRCELSSSDICVFNTKTGQKRIGSSEKMV